MKCRVVVSLIIATMSVAGCVEASYRPEQVLQALPDLTKSISAGETDRASVRRVLGEPLVTSDYWRFDAFRIKHEWKDLAILPGWMPVTMEEYAIYVLVAYDDEGVVESVNQLNAVTSSVYKDGLPQVGKVQSSDLILTEYDGGMQIAVGVTRRNRYLAESAGCTLVFGCAGFPCLARPVVDGHTGATRPWDLGGDDGPYLVAMAVEAGVHHVQVVPDRRMVEFEVSTTVNCPVGDVRYVTIDMTQPVRGALGMRWSYLVGLDTTGEMPPLLRDRPLVIWKDGTWLVPAEPGRGGALDS